jgi:hypothetical protein
MIIENIFKYSRTFLYQQVSIRNPNSDRGFFITYEPEYFAEYDIKQKRR